MHHISLHLYFTTSPAESPLEFNGTMKHILIQGKLNFRIIHHVSKINKEGKVLICSFKICFQIWTISTFPTYILMVGI